MIDYIDDRMIDWATGAIAATTAGCAARAAQYNAAFWFYLAGSLTVKHR